MTTTRTFLLLMTALLPAFLAGPTGCAVETDTRGLGQESSDHDITVMSLNARIDTGKDRNTIGRLKERMPRIAATVEHHNPDIVGLQEIKKKDWDLFVEEFGGQYVPLFEKRGGGATNKGSEGLAMLIKESRFEVLESTKKTVTGKERRKEGDCDGGGAKRKRIVMRAKLLDKTTGEKIDVFNTHFPTTGDGNEKKRERRRCEKKGMARIVRDYVRRFGDNVILMGDFNMAVEPGGRIQNGLKELLKDRYLVETYVETHDMEEEGLSFITGGADDPRERLGNKIDHIMVAPAFQIKSASIDRGLFDGRKRIECDDEHSRIEHIEVETRIGPRTLTYEDWWRTACCEDCDSADPTWFDVRKPPGGDLEVYSDHWAILSVVNRTPCKLDGCAATTRPEVTEPPDIVLPPPSDEVDCDGAATCSEAEDCGSRDAWTCSFNCCIPRVR